MASDGTIKIDTELDSSKAKSALSEFSSLGKTALNGVKTAISAAGAAMAGMAAYSVKVGSDFEAGMSKVSAISGAAGSELDALTDKAKEMGAKTKFSATEAASAFEYMAMAGWKTEDMLNGIEGIMNLAAASGEDLAVTSDIVTDALTGFGMQASDSAHFADVLATASSNSNTNVGMMGETFKYVAPVAGALGFSAEDCAVAIGLMANSGIKASQAGTTLRQIFTNLVKPTDKMQAAMDQLGFSLIDTEGNTKSLDTVMGELRARFAELTETEKAQYAATLAGKEGMSGFLAIVNASDADFNSLTAAIGNADGAAEKMAETMNDNLKGSITIAGSALEGFGIKVYEKMEAPLKEAVDIGTDCINRLSSAFDSGGLNGVVEEAGEIFNELADDIAGSSKAAEGIVTPLKNIANAGAKLGKTTLPVIADGLEFAAENFGVLLPLVTGVTVGLKAFNVIGKATAVTTKANAAAVAVLNKMEKANALLLVAQEGGLTVRQYLLAVYNGQMTLTIALTGLWTKAQTALNTVLTANPIGAVAAGIALLTAGVAAYKAVADKAKEKTYELSEGEKELLKSCDELTNALDEQRSAREKTVQSIDMEHDGYQSLLSELKSITDENGKVKAGYEERAKIIAGELSDALGMELSYIEGEIQMNGESVESMAAVCDAIDEVITKKKAEALCSAMQEEMAEAYKNSRDALLAYKDAADIASKKEAELAEAQQELNEFTSTYGDDATKMSEVTQIAYEEVRQAVEKAQGAYDEANASADEARASLNELSTEVNNYDALVEAMQKGTVEEIESAMNALVSGYQGYTEEMLAESQTARDAVITQAQEMTSALSVLVSEGGQMYQAFGDDAADSAAKAVAEFQKLPGGIEAAVNAIGTDGAGAMVAALSQADFDGKLSEESQASYEAFMAGLANLPEGTQEALSGATEGAMKGLESFDQIQDKAKKEGVSFLEALRGVLQINSPSKKVMEIFEGVWEGASDGLDVGGEGLNTKGVETCNSFLDTLRNSGFGEAMKGLGANFMSFFGIGVSSQQENLMTAGQANANAVKTGAGSVNPSGVGKAFGAMLGTGVIGTAGILLQKGKEIASRAKTGAGTVNPTAEGGKFGSLLGNGIGGMAGLLLQKGQQIANRAKSGAGSVNPSGEGGRFGSRYASGVGSKTGEAQGKGRLLASNADSGAKSKSGYDAGSGFGSGFVNGIGSWIRSAASKAAELASNALNAAKRALDSHSPSKKARKLGKTLPQGFGLGIEDDAKLAEKASENMTEAALDALDTERLVHKIESMDIPAVMGKVYAAMEDRHDAVTDKVIRAHAAKERMNNAVAGEGLTFRLGDEDIQRLAKAFSGTVSQEITKNMEGMGFYARERELFRLVREVK